MHVGVKRCAGAANNKLKKRAENERMLKASWDYWERQGLEHPMKANSSGIKPLIDIIRKGT